MTFGVLTILLGVVIFVVTKLTPTKPEEPAQAEKIDPNSTGKSVDKPEQTQKKRETPESLARWVLKTEKSKTELKEKLCLAPLSTDLKVLLGRDKVLVELFNAIHKGSTFLALYGRSGVGKTALALEVVRKYKYNFQNIKLYLSFGGEGENALSTRDAMIQIILSFRPTVRIPENMTQLRRVYRRIMARHQGVLVLDNVTSIDQVKELKPARSSSWLLIITAEKRLELSAAYYVEVEPLEVEFAQEFLVSRSLRLKPRSREIAKLCRGLPLTLEMCGQFLSAKTKMPPEDFVNLFRKYRSNSFLEKVDDYEESLLASFKVIYNSLKDKEQIVFSQLAVFPGSFDAVAASQVCEENGNCLKSLAQFGLVKVNPVTKRYILHDWVRSQLKNYLPEAIAREAKLRHATYYLSVLNTASEEILKGGQKARDGFQLFHREWANIRAGLSRVSKNSVEGKKAAELFNSYMIAGAELLPLCYFPKDCRTFLETGLKVSQRLDQKNIEVLHLLNLGVFHNSQKKYVEAEECLEQARQLASTLEDAKIEGKILNEMARLYLAKDRAEEAIDILLKKRKLCQENKIEVDEELSLLRLGLAYGKEGEFDKAIQTMKEGKKKAKEAGNGPCMGTLLTHIGFYLGEVKSLSNAEDYLEASLLLTRGLGKRKEELGVLLRYGKIYAQSDDVERALTLLREGLALAEKYRDNRYEGLFLVQVGDIYSHIQEKQKAIENYMKALAPLKKAKELFLLDQINRRLSQSFELEEDNEESSGSGRIFEPVKKLSRSKGLGLVQAKTSEFINRGDKKLLTYYIGSIEEIIKTYNLDTKEASTRESLLELMESLRENNHHACATLLKKKFSL
ncbi:MAG: tetratricopeptide repeat protein [Nitrospina sp.]|jgi:tetratricopeptide (TPR) repeat protein|nr:tetratricopeptide repeat protein [Nitrospina sp.]MBT3416027.1 tetratricopeptide repeat protein [Nitrospina sp.]MBT3855561.1 tetratricopeptide repeat protein [Nitrospina sp.]MBT4104747.1 tetratricopeptide repeat protein [Nitrospina sp.]MBT4389502.1 tetratricopeptide repeat protein [Nitrospina sp.]